MASKHPIFTCSTCKAGHDHQKNHKCSLKSWFYHTSPPRILPLHLNSALGTQNSVRSRYLLSPVYQAKMDKKPPSSSEWWFLEFKLAVWQVTSLHTGCFRIFKQTNVFRRRIDRSDRTVRRPHE